MNCHQSGQGCVLKVVTCDFRVAIQHCLAPPLCRLLRVEGVTHLVDRPRNEEVWQCLQTAGHVPACETRDLQMLLQSKAVQSSWVTTSLDLPCVFASDTTADLDSLITVSVIAYLWNGSYSQHGTLYICRSS